jgi:hypothetical protein
LVAIAEICCGADWQQQGYDTFSPIDHFQPVTDAQRDAIRGEGYTLDMLVAANLARKDGENSYSIDREFLLHEAHHALPDLTHKYTGPTTER